MSDFSRQPLELLADSRQRGYVGLHIEQGVPLLDRDLNLLHDLLAAGIRSLFQRYIGDGVAAGSDAFRIDAVGAAQDFRIGAGADGGRGWCLVGGLDVAIDTPIRYTAQPGEPPVPLTTPGPPDPDPREDTVYLEAWLEEVDGTPDLANADDIGTQTSTRLVVRSAVRVAEGGPVPERADGRSRHRLALLRRPHGAETIDPSMIVDLRQRRLTVTDLERRLHVVERVLLVPAFVPVAPSPALPQFSPTSGPAQTPVDINGTNFDVGRLQVLIGGRPAVLVDSASNRAVAKVPNGLTPDGQPTTVKITVQNEGGASTSDLDFSVQPKLAFDLPGQQLRPRTGPPGTEVGISGFNFNAGPVVVTVGAAAGAVQATPLAPVTNTAIRIRIPGSLPPGDVRVTVTLPTESLRTDDVFTVLPIPAPAFATAGPQFNPVEGTANTRVVLNGQNFDFTPTVRFGDTPAPAIEEVTATQITVRVPDGVIPAGAAERSVPIVVTNRVGGTATSSTTFRVKR